MRHLKQLVLLSAWGLTAIFLGGSAARNESFTNPVTPACTSIGFEGAPFTLCRFDSAHHDIRLILDGTNGKPLRTFEALRQFLGDKTKSVSFAINAGMYDWDGDPIGLYIEDGRPRHALNRSDGKGNFFLKPNGVLWMSEGRAHITSADGWAAAPPTNVKWATQSGPLLISDGQLHAKITSDGASHYIRNAAGVTAQGELIFAISDRPVSFGKIARLLRDAHHCPNVLYLDGYVSSLWDAASGRNDQKFNLGPMVVAVEG